MRALRTIKKIRTAARLPKKILSICLTSILQTCRKLRRKSIAKTAVGLWFSSAGASGSSWPARVIRIARPRGDWIRASECRYYAGRTLPEVPEEHGDPAWTLRRVHFVQRVSRVQVRETEFRGREMPVVHGRRTG